MTLTGSLAAVALEGIAHALPVYRYLILSCFLSLPLSFVVCVSCFLSFAASLSLTVCSSLIAQYRRAVLSTAVLCSRAVLRTAVLCSVPPCCYPATPVRHSQGVDVCVAGAAAALSTGTGSLALLEASDTSNQHSYHLLPRSIPTIWSSRHLLPSSDTGNSEQV